VTPTITIGTLDARHRRPIEEIVRATAVFNQDEVGVALELFDEAMSAARDDARPESSTPDSKPNADYEFIGAFDGDTLVGYACYGATPSTDRTYDLYWIAVHPDAQRSGTGGTLMAEVERRLDARRARSMVVETSSREDYARTRSFYHNLGYAEAARLRDFYAPGDDRVILSKRLTGSRDPGGNAAARPLPNVGI